MRQQTAFARARIADMGGQVWSLNGFLAGSGTTAARSALATRLALTAAATAINAAGGGVLFVPAGTWQIDATLPTWKSLVSLQGAGQGVTTLQATAATSGILSLAASAASVTVSDVTLDGNALATRCAVVGASATDITFRRCTFKNVAASGIMAITAASSARIRFVDCRFLTYASNVIGIDAFDGCEVLTCSFTVDASGGIGVYVGGPDVAVRGCLIDGNSNTGKQGIRVSIENNFKRCDVLDNRINNMRFEGIAVGVASGAAGQLHVSGNRVRACGDGTNGTQAAGINFYEPNTASAVTIQCNDNQVDACGTGINVAGGTTGQYTTAQLAGNTITGSTGNGADTFGSGMDLDAIDLDVVANIVTGGGHHGIVLAGIKATVVGNHISGNGQGANGGDGIAFRCRSGVLVGNACINNVDAGIDIRPNGGTLDVSISDIIVAGNTSRADGAGSQAYGIYLVDGGGRTATYVDIGHNNVRGNGTAGIFNAGATGPIGIHQNRGYATENAGTGTIANGATAAVVAHGLDYTPAAADIAITPTATATNDPGNLWVDTIGATNFTVNCRNNPGAGGMPFAWSARKV